MKLALFSDIHAHKPALDAVLDSIDAHRPDHIYCLGDLVGYAPLAERGGGDDSAPKYPNDCR